MLTPADALLSLSAIEAAVYDPPRLGHQIWQSSPRTLGVRCIYCETVLTRSNRTQVCPARPVPDPDWQACLFAADLCEDVLQDPALGAWWRWLHVERKVPTLPGIPTDAFACYNWWVQSERVAPSARVGRDLFGMLEQLGSYLTRRAAYLDLARAVCEQWRQEHEMRKEMTT